MDKQQARAMVEYEVSTIIDLITAHCPYKPLQYGEASTEAARLKLEHDAWLQAPSAGWFSLANVFHYYAPMTDLDLWMRAGNLDSAVALKHAAKLLRETGRYIGERAMLGGVMVTPVWRSALDAEAFWTARTALKPGHRGNPTIRVFDQQHEWRPE